MHIPRIQFGLRFLFVVMFTVALVGAALKSFGSRLPYVATFPISVGFACYITVLIVGLWTSLVRMHSAPTVYRLSAAACAVMLLSHLVHYAFQAAVHHLYDVTKDPNKLAATVFGWSSMIEQLFWALGLTLFLRAIQQRAGDIRDATQSTNA